MRHKGGGVMPIHRVAVALATCAATVGLCGTAIAGHDDEMATCRDPNGTVVGEFTIRASANSAGFESPNPFNVLIFEEGAVLTAHTVRLNGNVLFSHAVTGRAQNPLTDITCTFTVGPGMGAGSVFDVTGTLNTR
jgi:hypothetical protein